MPVVTPIKASARPAKLGRVLDFRELSATGEALEQMVRELSFVLGLKPRWSGRGQDAGRDLILEERGHPRLGQKTRRWLVSCKHFAQANGGTGRAVGSADVGADGGIIDTVAHHGADGYLLVCS